jgi:hypothetical protein
MEDIIKIRIKTKGIDMKENFHDPLIQWKIIYELTKLSPNIYKIFRQKFRPFNIEISHRLKK